MQLGLLQLAKYSLIGQLMHRYEKYNRLQKQQKTAQK